MIHSEIETKIKKQCTDEIVLNFIEKGNVKGGVMYECSCVTVFGTSYQKNQYVLLPKSKNESLFVGKIEKTLCCSESGYILYRIMISEYCNKTDLVFVKETDLFEILPIKWLADPRPLEVKRINPKNPIQFQN